MAGRMRRRIAFIIAVPLVPALLAACITIVSKGVEATALDKRLMLGTYDVKSPVKAHLTDGSTIVYREGIRVDSGRIAPRVSGLRAGPTGETVPKVDVPLDSILGLETYQAQVNGAASVVLSTLGTVVGAAVAAVGAVIIFGSCPTIYADSAGVQTLQAEVFATRISPLLEARDLDLLTTGPDSNGVLTLDVRNEALETHYINHFELLEISHARNRRLIPDEHGRPLLIGAIRPPVSASDRAGRSLGRTLASADGVVFDADSGTLARATAKDPFDYLDITFARPATDSAVVAVHLRNSLLNTVLLYDMMLASSGARSLDWLSRDMRSIGPVLQFGRWYREHFGLRVSVWDGRRWREIERHPTYGPVAWREAATVVPVLERDSLRVRFTFAVDEWRIDWTGVADEFSRPRPRLLPIATVRADNDSIAALAHRNMRSADERYLVTSPGQRFHVTFNTGKGSPGMARSYLLASQGYYSEWIRGGWVKRATDSVVFKPTAAALDRTLQRWRTQRDSIDRAFFTHRIPVGLK
ncbi:MAG TPA: hypothetical protein VE869_11585 [Gemmatimonas sp.]|nr:hypothetical protein [Gemmatimonas sp.]